MKTGSVQDGLKLSKFQVVKYMRHGKGSIPVIYSYHMILDKNFLRQTMTAKRIEVWKKTGGLKTECVVNNCVLLE